MFDLTPCNPRDWYWIVGGDESQVYSSARATMVAIDDETYAAWVVAGGTATHVATQDDLTAVLRAANVPPYHSVSTYRIVRRLEEAGKIDAADAALASNKMMWRRFYTVGAINADDPNALALLAAIGADPAAILAPE